MNVLDSLRPQNLRLTVQSSDSFDVREFAVEDGIHSLFSVDLTVRCANPAVDFEATIGSETRNVRLPWTHELSSREEVRADIFLLVDRAMQVYEPED